ncbi:hypothetical protein WS67_07780 [Burkholderia singularis]|uniref:Glycosyl transferase family 28 C-terminal domain-containing protein n=1 Tax=Burkholderia singularis TaxID=1503053 RepID=A0A103E596_9BURK|nr:hypothetical protein [Burkholderia singularis]KVE28619.1 hypothetical protein WS67_07780 [Burkholderia singularis]SMG02198.1 hypothetical protein BSIN_0817 [Burkholderia singularis]
MIIFAPNPTGSGHNMRALSIGQAIKRQNSTAELAVALGSLQQTFTPLFEKSGIKVIDIAGRLVDYSKKSNLSKTLDWTNYIGGYIANTFMSGERVLSYLALIDELKPDVLVSDYNMAACMAAIFSGTPLVFVTERYDFTLCQLTDEELGRGGFDVNAVELQRARVALHRQFAWMIESSQLVLTDKPYIESIDTGTPVEAALISGRAHFVGPMIREPANQDVSTVRADLGIGDSPYIIASISGTTMFAESKQGLLNGYIESYEILKKQRPDLKMVLLGRDEVKAGDGIITVPYYPNWMGLLKEAELLLSAPGWITVTEISALNIPTLFILPSNSEYHEVEALRRLCELGFPTYVGYDKDELAEIIEAELLKDRKADEYFLPHSKVASPDWKGADRAAVKILELAESAEVTDKDEEVSYAI